MPTEQDPHQEIMKLLKENNHLIKSMHRHMRAGQIANLIKITIAIALVWLAYQVLTPYIPRVQETISEAKKVQQQVSDGAESIKQLENSIR